MDWASKAAKNCHKDCLIRCGNRRFTLDCHSIVTDNLVFFRTDSHKFRKKKKSEIRRISGF